MIGIRVDANTDIAMGHLMRCMSIAIQLKNRNENVIFIVSEEYGIDTLMEKGFKYICLHNDYNDKESEVADVEKVIRDYDIDLLLIDSYQVSKTYFTALKKAVKLCYIDDMQLDKYDVDMIINYTFGTEEQEYKDLGYNNERLLLGSRYIPLRPEFSEGKIDINDKAECIFITTGGSDSYDMVCSILKGINDSRMSYIQKNIVVGKFYGNMDQLKRMAANDGKTNIYADVKDICTIMKESDIAVSAGGTTIAELLACGIPVICFSMADNQLSGTKKYSESGIVCYAGDVRDNRQSVVENIISTLEELCMSKKKRKELIETSEQYIDGHGAERIAAEIMKLK